MKPEEIKGIDDAIAALKITLSVPVYNEHAEALNMIIHRVIEIGYNRGRRWQAQDVAHRLGLNSALNGDR